MTPSYLPLLSLACLARLTAAEAERRRAQPVPTPSPWGARQPVRGPVARVPVLPLLTSAYPRRLVAR